MSQVRGVDVNIMGREFTISCTEEERAGLINAVNYLDRKMRDIRDAGKIIGAERIAIMAALNIAHELLHANAGGVNLGDYKQRFTEMETQIDAALSALK